MKKATKSNVFKKLNCSVFGHNYEVSKKVTKHVKEYTCQCCKKELTTNGNGYLTELTPKHREINTVLERIYTNKMLRLRQSRFYTSTPAYKVTA